MCPRPRIEAPAPAPAPVATLEQAAPTRAARRTERGSGAARYRAPRSARSDNSLSIPGASTNRVGVGG